MKSRVYLYFYDYDLDYIQNDNESPILILVKENFKYDFQKLKEINTFQKRCNNQEQKYSF